MHHTTSYYCFETVLNDLAKNQCMPSSNKIYLSDFISYVNLLSIKIASYLAMTVIFHSPFGFQQKFSRK